MSLMQMGLAGSILILVIVVLRTFTINRLPKVTFMVLWFIAVLRLLLPFSFPSRLSLYTWIEALTQSDLKRDLSMQNISPGSISFGENIAQNRVSSIFILDVLWLAGVVLLGVYFTISYIRCQKKFKMSLPVKNDIVTNWLREQVFKNVEVRSSDQVLAPLTYGLFHPVILLPKKMDWKDETTLRYILTHEYVHIRRFDAITKIILAVTLCIHWLNPIVWLMYFLANRDMELSCDETVVCMFGEEKKASYAFALIRMEETKKLSFSLSSHFSKNSIQERIIAIMKIKKTSTLGIAAAFILVAGTTTVFATSALSKPTGEIVSKEMKLTDEDGKEHSVAEEQLKDTVRYTFDENGQRIEAPNSEINTFLEEEGIQASPGTDSNDTTDYYIGMGEQTPSGTDSNDTTDYYIGTSKEPWSMGIIEFSLNSAPRTYTDEEMQKIIADIESGKIKPYEIPKDVDSATFTGNSGKSEKIK